MSNVYDGNISVDKWVTLDIVTVNI